MLVSRPLSALLAAGVLIPVSWLLPAPSCAQDNPRPGPGVQPSGAAPAGAQRGPAEGGSVLSVEFPGGTVVDYIKAVKTAAGGGINVLLPPEAGETPMPPVSLTQVTARTAVQTVEWLTAANDPGRFIFRDTTSPEDAAPTFALLYDRPSRPRMPGGINLAGGGPMDLPQVVRVFSLATILEDEADGVRDILAAIELAARMDEDKGIRPVEFLFHEQTRLLIARGTDPQLSVVRDVLSQVEDEKRRRADLSQRSRARDEQARLAVVTAQAELQRARVQIERCRSELAVAEKSLESSIQAHAKGLVSDIDVERARANVAIAQANVKDAEAHLVVLEERARIIQGGGPTVPAASGRRVVVAYNVEDLSPFIDDVRAILRAVAGRDASPEDVKPRVTRGGPASKPGEFVVRAGEDQHRTIVHVLNALRRVKSNEPKLPGQDPDDVLKKAQEE